jgi:hypothetical protein
MVSDGILIAIIGGVFSIIGIVIQTHRCKKEPNDEEGTVVNDDEEDAVVVDTAVNTTFIWTQGGNEVFIRGSFNSWHKIPMIRRGDDFICTLKLERGREYQYKFYVDNKWEVNPNFEIKNDNDGNPNNYIIVSDDHPLCRR